jgi:tRNA1(Val) A37 N6-methylase TrmN6
VTAGLRDDAQVRTVDAFLGGRVTLVQPRKGHRAGLDAALLQALVPADASGHAVDLGTGVGTVGFAMAARAETLRVTGIERDASLVACAQAALSMPENAGFAARVTVQQADVSDASALREALGASAGAADWVLMNPPYDAPGRAQPSSDPMRRSAHMAEPGGLALWCGRAAELLKAGGHLGLIYRSEALAEVLAALGGFGDVRILPVHPYSGEAATRILVRARRGSRAPLRLLPPLVLHRPGGAWTETADAILRGRAEISM